LDHSNHFGDRDRCRSFDGRILLPVRPISRSACSALRDRKGDQFAAQVLVQTALIERALSCLGVERATGQLAAEDGAMSRAKGLSDLLRPLVDGVAAGNRIGGHGFSTGFTESQQSTGEGAANLSLARDAAAEGRSQRQPLRLGAALAWVASGINRLSAVVML
jgi:hypothetical protein